MNVIPEIVLLLCGYRVVTSGQPTTDVDENRCVWNNEQYIRSLISPKQHHIQRAVSVLEQTSRQVREVADASQELQRGQAEVKLELNRRMDSTDHRIDEMDSQLRNHGQMLEQMMLTIDNIPTRLMPNSHQNIATDSQQRVSALAGCIPLLIQQNVNGSSFFNRSWDEFKAGFNDTSGNYWLGNELLSQLTTSGPYKLRFDLQSRSNASNWYVADYTRFTVYGEEHDYQLQVSGYSGNAGFDALAYHNDAPFSTYNRDNDASSRNCAAFHGGGFWHKNCYHCGVNSARGHGADFHWFRLPGGHNLQSSRMWLHC